MTVVSTGTVRATASYDDEPQNSHFVLSPACSCFLLGLHEIETGAHSPKGLIILELVDDESGCQALAGRLAAIEGIEVQQMVFTHA